jgi:hypothetical protein
LELLLSYAQQIKDTLIKESKIDEVAITGSRNKKRTVVTLLFRLTSSTLSR